MEDIQFDTSCQDPETLITNKVFDWEKDVNLNQENKVSAMEENENEESLVDSMLCDSNSRLIPTGFTRSGCTGLSLLHLNILFQFFFFPFVWEYCISFCRWKKVGKQNTLRNQ